MDFRTSFDDLILLLGIQSDVGKMLITSNPQKAEPLLEEWIEKFGNGFIWHWPVQIVPMKMLLLPKRLN